MDTRAPGSETPAELRPSPGPLGGGMSMSPLSWLPVGNGNVTYNGPTVIVVTCNRLPQSVLLTVHRTRLNQSMPGGWDHSPWGQSSGRPVK